MYRMLVLLGLAGCLSSGETLCTSPDGTQQLECPENTACFVVDPGNVACGSPAQVAACVGKQDGDSCDTGYYCHGAVCLPVVCGDGRVDPGEECDVASGGSCSPDCRSDLTCGNGVTDPAEQCDDGNLGSHDGCDVHCVPEIPHWTQLGGTPRPRYAGAMAYDATRDDLVLFGGLAPELLGDTWVWRHVGWQQVAPLKSPSPRYGHAMAYAGFDREVYLYGGSGFLDVGGPTTGVFVALDDLWRWNGTAWETLPVAGPPAVAFASLVYDAHRNVLVLFGGQRSNGKLAPATDSDETWLFDGQHWTQDTRPGPPARARAMMAYDAAHAKIVLFGGVEDALGTTLGDTWTYDAGGWTHLAPATAPPATSDATMGFDGTQIVMLGGTCACVPATDTYAFDGTTWRSVPVTSNVENAMIAFEPPHQLVTFGGVSPLLVSFAPSQYLPNSTTRRFDTATLTTLVPTEHKRFGEAAAVDLVAGHAVMLGGEGPDPSFVFALLDQQWQPLAPTGPGPSLRGGLAGAYDEGQQTTVFFGGTVAAGDVAETWLLQAGAWHAATGAGPDARHDHAMAYDAARGRTILFGGRAASTPLGDTWSFEAATATWTRQDGGAAPSARFGHGLAYDRTRREVVLFGGQDATGRLGDTWTLTDHGWTQVVLPVDRPQPAPRVGAALAWDPVRRHIILFGGESTTLEQDTWEWEGTTWTQLAIQPPPPRARGILLAAADGLVLYGGAARYEATTGDELGDLWLLRYDGAGASAACRDGSDDDGDGLAGCADPDCWLACHATCLPGDACTTPPTCGDGVCAPLEIAGICTADCAVAGICGDSTCTMGAPGECAGDCP